MQKYWRVATTCGLLIAASMLGAQSLRAESLPVGTVVASMLEKDQFEKAAGKSWVLAAGQEVKDSKYAKLTGKTTVPDLRGMFLRGANQDRNDAMQNPEAKALGDYQEDSFKAHFHGGITVPSGNDGGRSGRQDALYGKNSDHTGEAGGAETRPRNVTVNYFIKIN